MIRQLVITEDGSHTIFVPEMGEHFHSVHGAIQESRHIFIKYGYEMVEANPATILEIGFGTGLNALLTLMQTITDKKVVNYETWEAFPLNSQESGTLNYPEILNCCTDAFTGLHQAAWEEQVPLSDTFLIKKIKGDIRNFQSDWLFDLVYFDAFGPDYQPELWETEVFKKIASRMKPNSRLVTYSAKGQVRRNLKEAGFVIEKAPGPPGKREITIAIKI